MAKYSQAGRPLRVDTPLGEDALLIEAFSGQEGISTPFSFSLDLVSVDPAIDPDKLLRQAMSIGLELPAAEERVIHGMTRRFVQLGQSEQGELTHYRAEIVPWLWFLSLSRECRIFQEMSVLEIAEQVFKDQGYSDFEIRCVRNYAKREYCVQYRESHLNFVSRLLEEEGIFYFFEHSKSKHQLVLADDASAIKPCPGQAAVRLAPPTGTHREEDLVTSFQRENSAFVGKVTLRDYDYLQPSLTLETVETGEGVEEVYDFPGMYKEMSGGERLARLRLEEQEAGQEVVRGESSCRSLQSGYSFDLKEHYRRDLNKTYQLIYISHAARAGDYRGGEDSATFDYRNEFVAVPHEVPFRPPRVTPKPVVRGSQTAVVVGKAGEEIWVDKHGRVKVQFHWDREGKKDEKSSCWVRVSSTWAGKGWGFIQIPRIGQEVILDFLEGDPDQPIIIGRVYNAEQTPPYELPGSQTQSGVKSRSTKDGGSDNFNEIRMEDLKGSELLYVHAEKDKRVVVENDRSESVGHDEKIEIANDRAESVGNDENITIGNNRTESVAKNESISIGENRSSSVGKDETLDVGGSRSTTIAKNEDLSVGENRAGEIGKNDRLNVGSSFELYAGDKIVLETGAASLTMSRDGTITIKGKDITVDGSGNINLKAGGNITLKGSKIKQN